MTKTAQTQKQASGLLVYLLEELGDARLRCAQLKKYVKEVSDLIEKSEHRDHFFEVAGHLIHGIPDVVLRLDNALDASAMAAARLDYEEIKNGLLPEKAEALENVLQDNRLRYLRRRSNEGLMRNASQSDSIAQELKKTFLLGAEHPDSTDAVADSVQELVRVVAQLKDWEPLPSSALGTVPHLMLKRMAEAVWGVAFDMGAATAALSASRPAKTATVESPMNAKIAADMLNTLANKVEVAGQVPVGELTTLIAKLEGQDKTAATLAPKSAQAFRALATELMTQKNPSRVKLAGVLRRILADTMPMAGGCQGCSECSGGCGQQQAPLAGAGEDFQKANPKITDEDAAKIDQMHDEHKDVVKDKQAATADVTRLYQQMSADLDTFDIAWSRYDRDPVQNASKLNDALKYMTDLHDLSGVLVRHLSQLKGGKTASEDKEAALPMSDGKFRQLAGGIQNTAQAMINQVERLGGIENALQRGHGQTLEGQIREIETMAGVLSRRLQVKTASDDALLAAYPVSEEIESRFEEGKPADPTQDMSHEDAKEWKQNTEEYGDKFKAAAWKA